VITLVGLLGTIIGLIKGFTAVAQVNPAEKAEMLSASISIAMNNTAFALMVAIPFLLIHAFLQARTSEIVDGLESGQDQLPEPGAAPGRSRDAQRGGQVMHRPWRAPPAQDAGRTWRSPRSST
jgi:hypothetical protein